MRLRLPEEQWRRNRLAINVTAGLVFAGFTFVMPFLPLYVRECGVEGEAAIASWTGFLIMVAPLLAGLLAPAWGRISDRYGMKRMVERSTVAMAVHWALFGYARSVYDLLALRVMLGIFGGFGTLTMAMLAASTPKQEMSRSIGALQTVQIVSSAVGPLAGGVLADWIGIRRTCIVSSLFGFAALTLIHRLYVEPAPAAGSRAAAGGPAPRVPFRQAIHLPSFPGMTAVIFFVSFVERSFAPVVPLYVERLGTVQHVAKTAGLIVSLGLLSEAISATVMGNRLRKVPARRLLLWRLGGGVLACLPMGLVWATPQLLVLRLVLGLLAGGCMVVVYTLGSQIIPQETRATSFSFLSSAALLGGSLGPVAAGALTHVDIRAIFFFNSLVFLMLLGVSWKFVRDPVKPEPAAGGGGGPD